MKPRVRPISNLYFRWGQKVDLNADDVANALERAGLITRIGTDSYQEVKRETKLPNEEFENLILKTLNRYKEKFCG
jgi:hypothetical protein